MNHLVEIACKVDDLDFAFWAWDGLWASIKATSVVIIIWMQNILLQYQQMRFVKMAILNWSSSGRLKSNPPWPKLLLIPLTCSNTFGKTSYLINWGFSSWMSFSSSPGNQHAIGGNNRAWSKVNVISIISSSVQRYNHCPIDETHSV